MPDERIVLNGVNGATGEYLVPPLLPKDAVEVMMDPAVPDPITKSATSLAHYATILTQPSMGLPWDVAPERVDQAGWGIVFHAEEDAAVKEALDPLVEWRREQVPGDRFHILDYYTGESWGRWLARHGVAAGTVDPHRVPYYLLVVGDPALITFEFSHQLDVEYAVGRLHFDTPGEYDTYARSVVAYEKGELPRRAREIAYFAPRHDFDRATQLSADSLVNPLAYGIPGTDRIPAIAAPAEKAGFGSRTYIGPGATKATLEEILTGGERAGPAVLFTASHGLGWPLGDQRQRTETGALLCQDWPAFGTIAPEHYFSAGDLSSAAHVGGLVAIHFACYGAGTPEHDRFLHTPGQVPDRIAEQSFIAALPQRMLSHGGGTALACIGHVERAWGYSIAPRGVGSQILPFQNLVARILHGQPVGHAMKDINERFAVLGAALSTKLEYATYGRQYPEADLVADWIERNDAEGYLLIGDPATAVRAENLA